MTSAPSAPGDGDGARAPSFLDGGGAVGELVRAIDWSRRPLGGLEGWPQSLRTALSICLNSRFPIALYWGPQFIMLYNESLLPMVGANKHPEALGRPAFEVLPEIQPIIEPLLRHVRATGEATWSEDLMLPLVRGPAAEESYFTFTYSPIRDEAGGVGGVFCAVVETTEKVIEGRRLRLLNTLANIKGASTPAAACSHAAEALEGATLDLPSALIYLFDDASGVATLAGAANAPEPPECLHLGSVEAEPLERARRTGEPVFLEHGASALAAERAVVVLPMERSGRGEPLGFVVAGLSPLLAIAGTRGASYQRFHTLLVGAISRGVSVAASYDTERRRAESLAELDRAKTTFFSNVSHEFRTPLTLMLGPLDALAAKGHLPPDDRKQLQGALRNGQRILRLVNTLLDFSRMEAGRMRAAFEPTDLATLTAGIASAFESVVAEAGMRFTVECEPLPEPVWVDHGLWEKVVLNLVSNAFKFTFEGSITVRLLWAGEGALLSVTDTGTGIPEAEQARVFDRFYRVEGALGRSHEGSGIGLSFVQELVKLHGGTVGVTSAPGRGSTFTVSLPGGHAHLPASDLKGDMRSVAPAAGSIGFVDEAAQWLRNSPSSLPQASVERARHPGAEPGPEDRGHVLLVDDNADMRDYVRRTLEPRFTVRAVADGEAALEAAREAPPDVVLSDVMMPGTDGFALLRALREDPRTAGIPVILLSARAGEEATLEGLAAGATDYLVKPFSPRELRARVEGTVKAGQAKKERERLLREIEAARLRLENLIEHAPAFVCVLRGPDHVYEMVNSHCQLLLGAGRPLLGLTAAQALPELVSQGFIDLLDTVFRTGQPFLGNEIPARLDRTGTGALEDVYLNFIYQARRNARGAVEGIDCFGFDVTAQVLARNRAESLSAELRLANERKDEFLAMLAHELRNPMAAISLALSMLEVSEGDPSRTAKYRDTARRQMGNLVRLVDDLLDVSRITRGTVELRREAADLATIVRDAVAATRSVFEARAHELAVNVSSGRYPMHADPTRLEQVVVNLLTNAAKYTEPGGRISVSLSGDAEGPEPRATLTVRDSGRGIPAAMLDKVFDLFVQVSPTMDRTTGGLGLGLTLVRRLLEMHGGDVQARSEGPGLGSEFIVRLPLSSAEARPSTPLPNAPLAPGSAPARAARRRILLIEDSEDLRESLRDYLEASGHEVAVAKDGLEGLGEVVARRPDISLVDVGLPGIDGYELARRVRETEGGATLFLVALTGYGGPDAEHKAEAAGFDLHLTKPVGVEELLAVVERAAKA